MATGLFSLKERRVYRTALFNFRTKSNLGLFLEFPQEGKNPVGLDARFLD